MWWSMTVHSGLVSCLLCSTAVFRQSGMVYSGGTVHYIRYTIFTSFLLRTLYWYLHGQGSGTGQAVSYTG